MKQLVLTLAAIALLGNAGPEQRRAPATPIPNNCPLKVDFGSYGAGIDRTAHDAIQRLFARDRGVVRVIRSNWGREGEVTLCAITRTKADTRRLYRRANALVPAKPRGTVTISAKNVVIPSRR